MLKHLNLMPCITLLPMRKMLIIEYLSFVVAEPSLRRRDLCICVCALTCIQGVLHLSCTTFRVLLLRLVPCASIPLAVRASSLFRHFAMVSAYALPFLTLAFNFTIYWLRLFLAPAFLYNSCFDSIVVVTLSLLDGTSCWLDFNWGRWIHSSFELAELGSLRLEYLLCC